MDLRGLLRPVGHLPAGVYWRRRALVGVMGLVALIILWNLVSPGGSPPVQSATRAGHSTASTTAGEQSTAHTVATTPTHAAHPTVTHSPAAHSAAATGRATAGRCGPAALRLSVSVDHTAFPAGVAPRFVMTIANRSSTSCRIDVGPAVRSFTVHSGSDRIWSTADCAGTGHVMTTLRAHQQLAYAVVWQRHRSAAKCPANTAAALPGYYRVSAAVGSLQSSEAAFSLS